MTNTKRFAIAGGGISGLTLAIALQRKGLQVTVYEQATTIKTTRCRLVTGGKCHESFCGNRH